MGATFTGFMLNNRLWKGIKGNSAAEETGKHNLDQVTGFNTLNHKSYELHTIVVYGKKSVSFLWCSPCQNPQLQSNHEKNTEQTQIDRYSKNG